MAHHHLLHKTTAMKQNNEVLTDAVDFELIVAVACLPLLFL